MGKSYEMESFASGDGIDGLGIMVGMVISVFTTHGYLVTLIGDFHHTTICIVHTWVIMV